MQPGRLERSPAFYNLCDAFPNLCGNTKEAHVLEMLSSDQKTVSMLNDMGFDTSCIYEGDAVDGITKLALFLREKGRDFMPEDYLNKMMQIVLDFKWLKNTIYFMYCSYY